MSVTTLVKLKLILKLKPFATQTKLSMSKLEGAMFGSLVENGREKQEGEWNAIHQSILSSTESFG